MNQTRDLLTASSFSIRTWRGERGEEWSSAQGLESILISIQSLMSQNPYENEPGFEDAKSDHDKKNQEAYVAKVCRFIDIRGSQLTCADTTRNIETISHREA